MYIFANDLCCIHVNLTMFLCSCRICFAYINPFVTNGLFHPYQLGETTFILRGKGSKLFIFISFFSMKNHGTNRIVPDRTSRLGIFCLPMFHKWDARLISGRS